MATNKGETMKEQNHNKTAMPYIIYKVWLRFCLFSVFEKLNKVICFIFFAKYLAVSIYLLTFADVKQNHLEQTSRLTKQATDNMATAKRTFIRRAYKAIQNATSKKYYDECWQGVKNVVESIIGTDKGVTLYLENAGYEGEIGKNGHCKVYRYTIAGCDKDIDMQIIASFCGTVADPMSAYDLTVLMN